MRQLITDLASQAGPYTTYGQLMAGALVLGLVLYVCLHEQGLHPDIPAFGIDDKGWMRIEKARKRYTERGLQIAGEAIQRFSRPYQIATDVGVKIFLPARYAEEIKNNKNMSFKKAIAEDFFSSYNGLEPLQLLSSDHNIIQRVTRQNITQTLNLVTDDISEEAGLALKEILGDKEDWTTVTLKPLILDLIARLSSRLFVGTELCRNKEWLHLAKNYTLDSFNAARALRSKPLALRRLLIWFLPEWHKVRQDVKDARRILAPVINARLESNRLADEKGLPRPRTKDTIQWFYDAFPTHATTREIADAQLALSVVAIHTTTELLTGVLLDLAQNEEFITELRQDIVSILTKANESAVPLSGAYEGAFGKEGKVAWEKKTLYQMKLMDSALKETQRLHVRDIASMRRIAESEVKLSDGTVIPKGAFTWVTLEAYRNPERYPDPEVYNPRRFLDMRSQPGQENKWQLVSTSADHLGFGHGEHACPGRFFASNEVKIALVHLLMKYDWKLPQGRRPGDVVKGGTEIGVDAQAGIMLRRRKEEMQL
ncbi:Dihydromonacolin L monooxygenase LovA [Cytospora mali]|uniref:Dihydromonacolin L monooxygenase LovA n=1 Tax=Cytospora mali TaxID=578113 RepID=A0A194WAH5_CYTMA|nr:Dihydromonacolin L monooxygenase LovA [Valsa mali]